jgi:putative endonuclease
VPRTHQQRIGQWGEEAAARYLEHHGYQILARNVHTRFGEIDLVARQPEGELVFVEVKTRTNQSFGHPEEAVDARKLEHIFFAVETYLQEHIELSGQEWRVDVIAIQGRPGGSPQDACIEHFEHVGS